MEWPESQNGLRARGNIWPEPSDPLSQGEGSYFGLFFSSESMEESRDMEDSQSAESERERERREKIIKMA